MYVLMSAVTKFHETSVKAQSCLNSVIVHMLANHIHDKLLTHAGAELKKAPGHQHDAHRARDSTGHDRLADLRIGV